MHSNENTKALVSGWRRNTVLFMTSQSITLFGSSIVQMAMIWQVALETSSGIWVTLLTLASTIPQTIISLFSGVWADRYSRKRLIILADIGISAVTLLLAVFFLSGKTAGILPLIVIVSALRSVGTGIQTPAVSAVIPQLVPEKHLMRYNGINGSLLSIVQFVAPAAAGAILSAGPFQWVLLLDVITAVIGIAILCFVKITYEKQKQPPEPGSFLAEMKAGIAYAVNDRLTGRLLLSFGAFIFLCVPSGFLSALMIQRTFGGEYAFLTASEMVGFAGMVLGGILLGVWGGFKNQQKTLFLGLGAYGAFSIALGFAEIFWLFAVLMFFTSFCIPIVQSSVTTMLQEHVPEEKQGRVFGLLSAIYSGFMPLGMALFGPLSDAVRIQQMVIACGAVILLLALFVSRSRKS